MSKYSYFAHSIEFYRTHIESYCIWLIDNRFNSNPIWNPSVEILEKDYTTEDEIMNRCFEVIRSEECELVVFSTINGIIGKGVSQEIQLAKNIGKPVYMITQTDVVRVLNFDITPLKFSNRVFAIVDNIVLE